MTTSELTGMAAKASNARIENSLPRIAQFDPKSKGALAEALASIKPVTTVKVSGAFPRIAQFDPKSKGALAEALASIKPSTTLQKLTTDFSSTTVTKGVLSQALAWDPTAKSALAEALGSMNRVSMPKITGGPIQRVKLTPAVSPAVAEPLRLAPVVVDHASLVEGANVTESPPPDALAEVVASAHAREDREAAIELLTVLGLDDATDHLYEIESCLLRGRKPSRLHAALSASVLLRDLADRLFPARDEPWVARSGGRHPVGPKHVKNRLSAFVDAQLRSDLTSKEHQLFRSTLDVVGEWTGKGHHVPADPRQAAKAFRQLLEVLATIARAHRAA